MHRIYSNILVAVACGLTLLITSTTTTASAVSFHVTEILGCAPGPTDDGGCFGERVSIGIRVGGEPDEAVIGLGASVFDYDSAVASFEGGEAVDSIFHDFADPQFGAFDGLPNIAGGALMAHADGRIQIVNSASLTPHSANPLDPGLDGLVGGGDVQFRIVFQIVGPGITTLQIGTGYPGDVVVLDGGATTQANNVQVVISSEEAPYVIPEPSAAVLVGFGLVGLAFGRSPLTERS